MVVDLARFGYRGGNSNGATASQNPQPEEAKQEQGFFSSIGEGLKNAGKSVGSLFVSTSVNEPSLTQTVLTAGQTGAPDAAPPPADSASGYAQTSDRAIAPEQAQAPSAEMQNLTAYGQLRDKGFSHQEIYEAQTTNAGPTNADMVASVERGEGLVPKEQAQQGQAADEYEQRLQLAYNQFMSRSEEPLATNGISATMAGTQQAASMARFAT